MHPKVSLTLALATALASRGAFLALEHRDLTLPPALARALSETFPGLPGPAATFVSPPSRATVRFTLHENGNGTSAGAPVERSVGDEVDSVISPLCCEVARVDAPLCAPNSGARLVTAVGVRVMNLSQIRDGERVYCVPQGLHFVWPSMEVGHRVVPQNARSPIPGKSIALTQLSTRPRVFGVENFVAPDEIELLLRVNRAAMTPSEVGYGGWQDETRTSSTSWDEDSAAAQAIVRRTFEVLAVDYDGGTFDPLQVLRYREMEGYDGGGQWYKPHVDWFDLDDYANADPTKNNGTNRFATMFIYLTDVWEGGNTLFPLSTSHAGFNGTSCVHEGTVDTPGFIDTKEARQCCEAGSSALKSVPRQGNAVLFYSQQPDGSLDPYSLHGGCPPISNEKWSGNVWVWNRPHPPDEEKLKDLEKHARRIADTGMPVRFANAPESAASVDLYYDALNTQAALLPPLATIQEAFDKDAARERYLKQLTLEPGKSADMDTFPTHVFVGVRADTGRVVFARRMREPEDDEDVALDDDARVPLWVMRA